MAVPSQLEDVPLDAGDSAFLEQAYLTYIIPFGTDVNIEEEIQNAVSNKHTLEDIESRSWLFFGKDPSSRAIPLKFSCLTILIHRFQMKLSTYSSY